MYTLPRPVAFVVTGTSTVAMLSAAAAPSPLYPVYQQLWGFSSFTLTVIFAVYVLALIGSLLTVGSVSDLVGRCPVVIGALTLLAVSMLLFVVADGVPGLIAARVVQGLATGAATGTLTAMTVDLQPSAPTGARVASAAPTVGLFAGAMLAGALVQYASYPRYLVFWVLLAAYIALIGLLLLVPEAPRATRPGRFDLARALRPTVGVPPAARRVFVSQVPAMISTWALGGLYLSLGSSVIARVLGVGNHFVVGSILGTFFLTGAVGAAVTPRIADRLRRPLGLAALAVGVVLTLAAMLAQTLPLYVVGSAIAGFGFGATFLVVMAAIADETPADQRGQTFATTFVVSYTAFSLPALVAGLAVEWVGLRTTVLGYCVLELVLVAAAMLAGRARTRVTREVPPSLPDEVIAPPRQVGPLGGVLGSADGRVVSGPCLCTATKPAE
ncbi:MFS transporter [Antrihabitans cavernicola]|uniref:MFS transporter n=1 Tax=Antrihabitans cavernicola TaxID=2495913 RepID=A0A5A7S7M4_9NOCA|nr:MFS transporter [Spelaeibacter cavernicola]